MSISLDGTIIRIEGPGRVEDAEPLLALLQAERGLTVDLTAAGHLHAAVVQVLMVLRPVVIGPAGDPFVHHWLMPFLT
jgi:hypothetical protein